LGGLQTRRQGCADPATRLARVLPNNDASGLVAGRHPLSKGASNRKYGLLVERILACDSPNSICSE
jgi:hypothetical protein